MNIRSSLVFTQMSTKTFNYVCRVIPCQHICTQHQTRSCGRVKLVQRYAQQGYPPWTCHLTSLTSVCVLPVSHVSQRGMAGHSKWQNIRKIKEGKDKEKAKVSSQMLGKIASFIKETGNSDPKASPALAKLIEQAKAQDVPNSSIETAISKAKKSSDSSKIQFLEGRGLAGSFFVLEVTTDKPTKTKNDLQGIVKKFGAELGEMGSARHAFDYKGTLEVMVSQDEGEVDMDKYVDIAIQAGAEDVSLDTDNNTDDRILTFLCEPDDIYSVKKELEKQDVAVSSFNKGFHPTMRVSPQGREMELIVKLMERLESHADVLRIFINVHAPDS